MTPCRLRGAVFSRPSMGNINKELTSKSSSGNLNSGDVQSIWYIYDKRVLKTHIIYLFDSKISNEKNGKKCYLCHLLRG